MKKNKDLRDRITQDIEVPEKVNEAMKAAYDQLGYQPQRRHSFRFQRRAVVVAACVCVLGTTATVFAANGFFGAFQKESKVNQDDTLNYTFQVNYEMKPGVYEVDATYLPKGFIVEDKDQQMVKCSLKGAVTKGLTILPVSNTNHLQEINDAIANYSVDHVDHKTINGMAADILTMKDTDREEQPTILLLFNPQEGYAVEIWASYGMDTRELEKVAEGLKVTKTGEETAEMVDSQSGSKKTAEDKQLEKDQLAYNQKAFTEGMDLSNLKVPGEEAVNQEEMNSAKANPKEAGYGSYGYTITDVSYSETLPQLDQKGFYQYSDLEPWLNADGSLKNYTRCTYTDSKSVDKEESCKQEFMTVKVKVHGYYNNSVIEKNPTALDAQLVRLKSAENGVFTLDQTEYQALESEHNYINNGDPIYISNPQYQAGDSHFFWNSVKEGEDYEYTLVYVIDKDMEGKYALQYNGLAFNGMDTNAVYGWAK